MRQSRKQKGFTIIELVVVILLLGILTATVLPRFMDISDDAHRAVVRAVQGSLNSGLLMYRAEWIAEGQGTGKVPTSYRNDAVTHTPHESGYPNATTHAHCAEIYSVLMSGAGSEPTVDAADSTSGSTVAKAEVTNVTATSSGTPDFIAAAVGEDPYECYFIYRALDKDPAGLGGNFYLVYNPATGSVVLEEAL